jgi:predicted nucleic acid-binding protein
VIVLGASAALGWFLQTDAGLPIEKRRWLEMRITKYPDDVFLPGIWPSRHNYSIRQAAYLILTRRLCATLLTRDPRLATVCGFSVKVEVF